MFNKAQGRIALVALADAVAAVTGLPYAADGVSAIWTLSADESRCPPERGAYTTFRIFGAVPAATQPNAVAVQAATVGPDEASAMERAERIHDALLDPATNDSPRRAWAVTAQAGQKWLLDVFELEEPRVIASDARQRADVVSNFVLAYRRVS